MPLRTLFCVNPSCAVNNTLERAVQAACLDHLILVLNQEFDALDRGCCGFGYDACCTTDGKGLGESKIHVAERSDQRNILQEISYKYNRKLKEIYDFQQYVNIPS